MVEIGRVRVKTGNAAIEQKISAYPPQADLCAHPCLYERVTLENSPSELAAADQRLA
jgi:hypothetical protein